MQPRIILAISNFFAVAHFYLIVYIATPYLSTLMSADTSALAIALGAIITLSLFPTLPRLVVRHGPQRMAVMCAGLEGIVLLLLATNPAPLVAILLIAVAFAIPPFIVYQLDLLLEASTSDETTTGRVRTAFNTSGNIALILAPLLIGVLLGTGNEYRLVFLAAALSIVPFILCMFVDSLPKVHPPNLRSLRIAGAAMFSNPDRRASAGSNLVLQFFFHLVPLYVPLYLHTVLGFEWLVLGPLFAISLIPFVFEYVAGWVADTKVDDSILLALGFIISGLSFASLMFVTSTTPLAVLAAILITMRIGGALVEAMTDVHFFRKISSDDVEAVSIYRMMRPVGALITPIIGSILLSAGYYSGLFVVSGFGVLIAGIACAYAMHASYVRA